MNTSFFHIKKREGARRKPQQVWSPAESAVGELQPVSPVGSAVLALLMPSFPRYVSTRRPARGAQTACGLHVLPHLSAWGDNVTFG